MTKKKAVASVSSGDGFTIGASDVIRWGDIVNVQGHDIDVAKAVELGLKYKIELAEKMEVDLKSKIGLLLTFPIAMLMDKLQREIGTGEEVLALVKPN